MAVDHAGEVLVFQQVFGDPYQWYLQSPNFPILLVALFLASHLSDLLMKSDLVAKRSRVLSIYRTLDVKQQRRLLSHVACILVSSIKLVLQLRYGHDLIFNAGAIGSHGAKYIRLAGSLSTALYIYELLYNLELELNVMLHHSVSIIAFLTATFLAYETKQPQIFLMFTAVFMFHDTLSQPSHIALVLRKFFVSPAPHPRWQRPTVRLLVGSTVWYILSKAAVNIFVVVRIIQSVRTPTTDSPLSVFNLKHSVKTLGAVLTSLLVVAMVYLHVQCIRALIGLCRKDLKAIADAEHIDRIKVALAGDNPLRTQFYEDMPKPSLPGRGVPVFNLIVGTAMIEGALPSRIHVNAAADFYDEEAAATPVGLRSPSKRAHALAKLEEGGV